MTAFDWSEFEAALFEELRLALVELGKAAPTEQFYAVALYHVYRELDGLLSLPTLGAATERGSKPDEAGNFWAERWNPHGWSHAEVLPREAQALQLETALTAEANSGTQAQWRKTEARYFKLLLRLTRRLRDAAPQLVPTTPTFVTFWHDDEGGVELARKTIPKRRFEVQFRKDVADSAARAAASRIPVTERAAYLVTRFGEYSTAPTSEDAQRGLLAIGAPAIPALLKALNDKQDGWLAAKLLGSIGVASPEVLRALRALAPGKLWPPAALGMLGDLQWAADCNDAGVAVAAFTANLKAISTEGRVVPLDYAPLEAFLATATPEVSALIEEELKPGTSYTKVRAADVPEALRGLHSDYAVVRWHAAGGLGNRGLGPALGRSILPALVASLQDDHHLARRLSLLSISYWKESAKPHRDAIAALASDPDEVVRRIAGSVLSSWT